MSLSLELAAYHEAGHALRAYRLNRESLHAGTISIKQVNDLADRWNGTTGVNLQLIPVEFHIDIALAGFLAEARFNGIQNPLADGNATLVDQPVGLGGVIRGYFDLARDEDGQTAIEQTPVNVISAGLPAFPIRAAISFADLDSIPPAQRHNDHINQAIARLVPFFNDNDNWSRIQSLAEELADWEWPEVFDYAAFCEATGLPW